MSLTTRRVVLLMATVFIGFAAGCASAPSARHKDPSQGMTVSLSEKGLNFWTEARTDVGYISSNIFVSGRDFSGIFQKSGARELLMDGLDIAVARMKGAAMPLVPVVEEAFRRETAWPGALRLTASASEEPSEAADVQIIPMVHLFRLGEGKVGFTSELLTRYKDDKGERHRRTYQYHGRFILPWVSDSPSWSGQDHLLFKRQVDSSFAALVKVFLRDVRGDFNAEARSANPRVLHTRKELVTIQTILLAEFDQLRVVYERVGDHQAIRHLTVYDDSPQEVIFGRR